ncbi:MAG: zinc-ribbon domain-containing protein [Thermoplasmatota archaeon]|jgi:hypothetical protein
MIYCSKCGKENDDNAEFCNNCGNSLTSTSEKTSSFENYVEKFASDVEKAGKNAGKKIEKAAKKFGKETQELGDRFEKAADRASNYFENWYDKTFGVFGPLISSFVGLIILRLVIEGLKIGSEETPVLLEISDFLLNYLLFIFIVLLVSSYTSYVQKKYKIFRWVLPVIFAILLVFVSFIVVNIVSILGTSIGEPNLANAEAEWQEKYMIMIFVIVLLIGYLVNVATVAFEKDQKK